MEKIRTYETVKTTSVIAHWSDFDGSVEKWQQAYFQLLSLNNTYSFAYEMDVHESSKNGVFVCVVLRCTNYKDRLVDYMNDLGYRAIKTYAVTVAVCELPDGCDYIFEG